ncbi:MAG: pyridoxamine 5'-phosphate oxidase family protein [Acidobacteria bacterium]|nr:pyridoxamine 5'-phosphate oxidase family protein [Acidobacteriota bacterium]
MARLVGTELPEDLYQRLNGAHLEASVDKAILICTVDNRGWPHPAMLSYFEVIAKDRRNIRLATYRNSTTTGNMRHNGKLTISVMDERIAYYIKGNVQEIKSALNSSPQIAKLNLVVEEVLADHADERLEADVYITSGVTFRNPHMLAERLRASGVLRELLE